MAVQPRKRLSVTDKPKPRKKVLSSCGDFFTYSDGLYLGSPDKPIKISSPLRVLGRSASIDGANLRYVIAVETVSENELRVEVPVSMTYQPARLADELMTKGGLRIELSPESRQHLVDYIRNSCPPDLFVRSQKEGWVELGGGKRGYIVGKNVFSKKSISTDLILDVGTQSRFAQVGMWATWRETATLCNQNPILMAMLCGAFSSALLAPFGRDSSFLMLVGPSSTGKSTVLKLCNSLYTHPDHLLTWEGTANGIEAAILQHTDMPVCLDEIGQSDVDILGGLAYLLTNAAGKLRATANSELAQVKRTRTIVLSAGEESAIDRMDDAGKKTRLGQYARFISIPVKEPHGIFTDLHGAETGTAFADYLNQNIRKAYGIAWLKYVEHIANLESELLQDFEKVRYQIRSRLVEGIEVPKADGVFARVLEQFSLMAFAGFTARTAKVVEWKRKEIIQAIRYCFGLWFDEYQKRHAHPNFALLEELRYLLQANRHRLPPLSAYDDKTKHSDVGFVYKPRGEEELVLLIFPGFLRKKFSNKLSIRALDAILLQSGYLIPGPRNGPTKQVRIPGMANDRIAFYALKRSFLGEQNDAQC
jgi:putative DNA primase/helicase